mgnify:CR=1 FL=1
MMQNVKIESIRHGWFAMRFGGYEIDCTNVFEHDTPMKLLQAVYDLVQKNDVLITVYETSKSAYDLNCSAEHALLW